HRNGAWSLEDTGSWQYRQDNAWHLVTTEVNARRLAHDLEQVLARHASGPTLSTRFRVERTSVGHNDIPARYTPLLLDDIGATLPQAAAPPLTRVRPACVANDDWLTAPPQKPGGTAPPPPRPATGT
ncbi:MAG: hypothetical protein ABL982_22950, partial [Vicinamibacterales bacterium]